MSQTITVTVGEVDLNFNVGNEEFNKYINDQQPDNKVSNAFNFLSRNIDEESKEDFEKIAVSSGTAKGVVVMSIVQVVSGEFGSGVEISIKKPKGSQTK